MRIHSNRCPQPFMGRQRQQEIHLLFFTIEMIYTLPRDIWPGMNEALIIDNDNKPYTSYYSLLK
jgi:hypothetical protein